MNKHKLHQAVFYYLRHSYWHYWLGCWALLCPLFVNAMDLRWLASGEVQLASIKLSDTCPKRYLEGISVTQRLNTDPVISIDEVHWQLNCEQDDVKSQTVTKPASPQQTLAELADLLNQLDIIGQVAKLPSAQVKIKQIRLYQAGKPWLVPWQLQATITPEQLNVRLYEQVNQLKLGLDRASSQWQLELNLTASLLNKLKLPLPTPLQLQPTIKVTGNLLQPLQLGLQISSSIKAMPWLDKGQMNAKAKLDLAKQRVLLTEFNLLSMLNWQQLRVAKAELTLSEPASFDFNQLKFNAELALQKGKWGKHQLPDIRLASDTRYQLAKQRLDAAISVSSLRQLIEGKLALTGSQLRFELIPAELALAEASKTGSALRWLDKTQIDSGQIGYQGRLEYHLKRKNGRLDFAVNANKISGLMQDILVDNAQLKMAQGYDIEQGQLRSRLDENHLSIDLLDVGVPLSAINLDFKADINQPEIRDLSAYVLGGELRIKRFKPLALGRTNVSLKGIQLAGLLAYGQLPGATATGVLDANIPLLKEADGFHIYQGEIASRAPGGHIVIPDSDVVQSIASTNVGVEFIFKILEDLRYSDLIGKLNYQPDGEMQIEATIKGNSPHVSKTRPIEFNYSHQENLIQLLRSLRFSNELERKIEDKYL